MYEIEKYITYMNSEIKSNGMYEIVNAFHISYMPLLKISLSM
jgi:hypothetical protein